ncbi:MAG: hypothetical protein AMJ79_12005, partial [Phycisphaerae bacterium SM23_30]
MRKQIISIFIIETLWLMTVPRAWGQSLPPSYDLRDHGRVTAVRKQKEGTCWAHGIMATLESNLLTTGVWAEMKEKELPNLAEYHLDWWNGFNRHNNDDLSPPTGDGLMVHQGGNYRVSSAYLARGEGAIYYPDANNDSETDDNWYHKAPARDDPNYHLYYVRDIEWFTAEPNLSNIDTIKEVIVNKGAIATCYHHGAYIFDYVQYQSAEQEELPNHSVAIIGWDDSKVTPAPLPGAWLAKNSWGTIWGELGYFWISYYDKWCGQEPEMGAVSFQNVEPMVYDQIYYHDYHGWRDTKTDISEAFNAFTAGGNQLLKGVSFYTAQDNVNYTVKIYDRFEGGQLLDELAARSGTIQYTGFHTIDLDTRVILAENDEFYVYLYLSKGGHAFDRTAQIPVLLKGEEEPLTVVKSSAYPGESYYYNGSAWEDLYGFDFADPNWGVWDRTANFCIKALAVSKPIIIKLIERPAEMELSDTAPKVQVEIKPGVENLEPNSVVLWHRYDEGAFTSIAMTSEGNDFYGATLPTVDWGDKGEFYIRAQGNQGGIVNLPENSPSNVFTFFVGETRIIFADNFEEDQGWAAENLGASSGDWQRGVPVNDPLWSYDPHSDSDGSGRCFLTQNETGNTDVDDGAVRLTAPRIDMSFGR